jgi:DNA-binding NarL/FixJ family response regulator
MVSSESLVGGHKPTSFARNQPGGFSIFKNPPCIWPESMAGQPGAPVRVHIVDGDAHLRGVIAQELMSDSRTMVAGQAGSLRDARRLIRGTRFDVLLVEVSIAEGDESAFDLISLARSVHPAAEVVVLAREEAEEEALRAFHLGAAGFLVKNSHFIGFVQAVLQVANGGAAISPALSRRLLLKQRASAAQAEPAPCATNTVVAIKLSSREHEVLRMIASGLTSTEIGERLLISCTTVNSHVKNMYQKLHVRSRAQAVSCANAWGLL